MARAGKGQRAFTLLEMLVALSLMAMLASALYMSLHIGFRARRSARAAIEPVRRAVLALELMRRDVESALVPSGILAAGFLGQDEGTGGELTDRGDALAFYTASDDLRVAGPGALKVEFALLEGADDDVLVRRLTRNLLAPETPDPEEEVLCRGVESLDLRYFDGSDWLDNWDSSVHDNALPLAVEVEIVIRDFEAPGRGDAGYRASEVFLLPCAAPAAAMTADSGPAAEGRY